MQQSEKIHTGERSSLQRIGGHAVEHDGWAAIASAPSMLAHYAPAGNISLHYVVAKKVRLALSTSRKEQNNFCGGRMKQNVERHKN